MPLDETAADDSFAVLIAINTSCCRSLGRPRVLKRAHPELQAGLPFYCGCDIRVSRQKGLGRGVTGLSCAPLDSTTTWLTTLLLKSRRWVSSSAMLPWERRREYPPCQHVWCQQDYSEMARQFQKRHRLWLVGTISGGYRWVPNVSCVQHVYPGSPHSWFILSTARRAACFFFSSPFFIHQSVLKSAGR